MKNVKDIQGGSHHTVVLTNDKKIFTIGRKDYGRLGLGNLKEDITELTEIVELRDKGIVHISCGAENSFGLSDDGKVYVWGNGNSSTLGTGEEEDVPIPKQLVSKETKEKTVLAVSGGGQHSLFLVEDTSVAENGPTTKAAKGSKK